MTNGESQSWQELDAQSRPRGRRNLKCSLPRNANGSYIQATGNWLLCETTGQLTSLSQRSDIPQANPATMPTVPTPRTGAAMFETQTWDRDIGQVVNSLVVAGGRIIATGELTGMMEAMNIATRVWHSLDIELDPPRESACVATVQLHPEESQAVMRSEACACAAECGVRGAPDAASVPEEGPTSAARALAPTEAPGAMEDGASTSLQRGPGCRLAAADASCWSCALRRGWYW